MKLILVRHGETEENVSGITQGQFNFQLNENGKEQIIKVALRLKDFEINHIYSSDLDRASDTTKEILRYHPKINSTYTPLLREQRKGIYEGCPKHRFNGGLKDSGLTYWDFRAEGGENMIDVEDRVMELYNQLDNQSEETVLFVAHGGPIAALLMKLLGAEPNKLRDYITKNTSVSILDVNSQFYTLELFNCIKHLD